MSANVYEAMFLLDTNKVAGDVPSAAGQLHSLLEKNNAEVLVSRPWDERKLAYPIKKHKKGLYYLTYIRTEGKNLINMERDIALNELILRHLVLRVDSKLVETMLTVARDEKALALQSIHEGPEEGGSEKPAGEDGADRGRGPRRPRREPEEAEKG